MASYPPPVPPPVPPPGYDPRASSRYYRDQARAQRAAERAQREQYRYQMRGLRRGSVLGPILLIGIGILFLMLETGRLDHDRFWGWYGHWWPLLLVGAGVIVLAEWAFDQFNLRDPQRPAYRRSLGGGVGLLLLLLIFSGIAASKGPGFHPFFNSWMRGMDMGPDSMDELFGDKHESDQTLDLALPAGGSLAVVNPRGDVTISGTSDDDRVHVAIHKQVYARTDSDADSKAQRLSPATNTDGSELTFTMPAMDGASDDLVIQVPAAAQVAVTSNHGDIHVASIKAPVSTTANHGDIELSAITGQATAHINNSGSSVSAHDVGGGVTIQGRAQDVTLTDITGPVAMSGDFFGTTHLEHINGAIHFHTSRTDIQFVRLDGESEISGSGISADQVLGPVVLSTSNRDVTLDRIAGDIAVTNKNGTIDLTAAPTLGNITLANHNGAIKTTLPEHASFSVQATTSDGDTSTDFSLPTSENGDHKTINGVVGAGGPMLRITTTNGDISIHKGDVQPVPLQAPAPPKITLTPPPTPPHPPKH
jgi:DUF4097 and DUF4098 domain-containing protein YvlB